MRIPNPWASLFPVIGVVHLEPLPGAPSYGGSLEEVVSRALEDASAYVRGGADAIIVENHGDAPFAHETVEPHVPALLARCALEIKRLAPVPVGINCLRNDAFAALGAALAAGAEFIRVNVLVGATATDQGIISGRAHDLLRYRSHLGASVQIFADVDVKFGTPLYRAPLEELAKTTLGRGGADGLIVTGRATGSPPSEEDVEAVQRGAQGRGSVLIGSGATPETLTRLAPYANGVIVGTWCKKDAKVEAPVDSERVKKLLAAVPKRDASWKAPG